MSLWYSTALDPKVDFDVCFRIFFDWFVPPPSFFAPKNPICDFPKRGTIMKQFLFILALALLWLPKPVFAVQKEAGSAAQLVANQITDKDWRVQKLESFLAAYKSPMAVVAKSFVTEADRLNLDWKLVVAIAGTESTFGKHTPTHSYNGWGWAVFTGKQNGASFKSWKEGITAVSEGLRKKYIDQGARTIEQIGYRYADLPAWASHVHFFINKIEAFVPSRTDLIHVTL